MHDESVRRATSRRRFRRERWGERGQFKRGREKDLNHCQSSSPPKSQIHTPSIPSAEERDRGDISSMLCISILHFLHSQLDSVKDWGLGVKLLNVFNSSFEALLPSSSLKNLDHPRWLNPLHSGLGFALFFRFALFLLLGISPPLPKSFTSLWTSILSHLSQFKPRTSFKSEFSPFTFPRNRSRNTTTSKTLFWQIRQTRRQKGNPQSADLVISGFSKWQVRNQPEVLKWW